MLAQTTPVAGVDIGHQLTLMGVTLVFVVFNSALLLVATWVYSMTIASGRQLTAKLFTEANPAVGIAVGGFILGVAIATGHAQQYRPGGDIASLAMDLLKSLVWSLFSIAAMLTLRWVGDVVTPGSWTGEIFDRKNMAVAWVEAALFISLGVIVSIHVRA